LPDAMKMLMMLMESEGYLQHSSRRNKATLAEACAKYFQAFPMP
jgi:hypothetical protein